MPSRDPLEIGSAPALLLPFPLVFPSHPPPPLRRFLLLLLLLLPSCFLGPEGCPPIMVLGTHGSPTRSSTGTETTTGGNWAAPPGCGGWVGSQGFCPRGSSFRRTGTSYVHSRTRGRRPSMTLSCGTWVRRAGSAKRPSVRGWVPVRLRTLPCPARFPSRSVPLQARPEAPGP